MEEEMRTAERELQSRREDAERLANASSKRAKIAELGQRSARSSKTFGL